MTEPDEFVLTIPATMSDEYRGPYSDTLFTALWDARRNALADGRESTAQRYLDLILMFQDQVSEQLKDERQ